MQTTSLAIPDVVLLRPPVHADARGTFCETYNRQAFSDAVAPVEFVQDNEAVSAAVGTIRGLHFQREPMAQGKLVRVLRGAVLDVVVDIRPRSPTFGQAVTVRLDAACGEQLWVPPGFAHGYCTLAPETVVAYKVTRPYSPAHDGGILWDDPALGIAWPVAAAEAVLSDKDRRLPRLADLMPSPDRPTARPVP